MQRTDIRSTILVMLSLAFATLTGFLRQSVVAGVLGAGRAADIYLVGFAVPEFVFIALPIVLTPVIIPVFSQIRQSSGESPAWRWGGRLSGWLLLLILGLTLAAGLSAPLFIPWLSPGFSASERQQAVQVFYRMLPGLLLMGASVLAGSFLQVYRKFARPVLTTAVYNLVFMGALLYLPLADPLQRAGWGVTLGATGALLFQLPLLWRVRPAETSAGDNLRPASPSMREALRLTAWMAAGYGAHHLILFIDRAMATSLGAGSAAVLNYGYHLALAVGQLSGLAVATAMFPGLSEQVGIQELDGARRSISHALGLVWGLALPASLAMVLLRVPIVQVLLQHGAFPPEATQSVGRVMAIYAIAVLADALCQPLWRAVYAQQKGGQVLLVNGIQTAVRLTANLLLIPQFGYNGLAISAIIGLSLQVILLTLLARRNLRWSLSKQTWILSVKIFTAGFAAYGVTWIVKTWFENSFLAISPIFLLLAGGALILVVYAVLIVGVFKIF